MQGISLLPDSAISWERTVMGDRSWEMLVVTSGTSVDRAAPSAPMAPSKFKKRRGLRTCRFPEFPAPCGYFLVFFILGYCPMHNQSPASFATLTAVKMMWWFWVEGSVNITIAREKQFSEATYCSFLLKACIKNILKLCIYCI